MCIRDGSLRGGRCREDPDPEEEEVLIFLIESLCLGHCTRMMRMMIMTIVGQLLDHFWITFGSLLEHFWNIVGALVEH